MLACVCVISERPRVFGKLKEGNVNVLCLNQRWQEIHYSFLFCFLFPFCTAKGMSLRGGIYLLREGDLPSFKGKRPLF